MKTTSPNSCCKSCWHKIDDIGWWKCFAPDCRCHATQDYIGPTGMESKGNSRLTCGCDGNDLDQFGKCPCYYTKSDWAEVEAEFDENFTSGFRYFLLKTGNSDSIKKFYRRHLEAAREEAIREHDAIWHPIVEGKIVDASLKELRKHWIEEGRQQGTKEALRLMPKKKGLFESEYDEGFEDCRTAIINALEERMK